MTHLLGELLIEELRATQALPLHLPWPRDEKLRALCDALMADPGRDETAAQWADKLALGEKTFHRRFIKSTGVTFGKWRQRLRLMSSLTLLTQGAHITAAAMASGYDSHSAYTSAFKRQFGMPPSAFTGRKPIRDIN
ncbi:AraC family transcriptional regulator [Ectopseudomonas mendocina]|uniref:AraC family transcriptional regulator n=1 Tax=Ectopseudomonas mendocina TaxID=300 RepID=A0ABZ2RLR7_ECTME